MSDGLIQTKTGAGGTLEGKTEGGLEGDQFVPLVLGAIMSLILDGMMLMKGVTNPVLLLLGGIPFGLASVWVFGFMRNRPPHFSRDFFLGLALKGRIWSEPFDRKANGMFPAVMQQRKHRNRR